MSSTALSTNNDENHISRSRSNGKDDSKLRKPSVRRQPLKSKSTTSIINADQLVNDIVSKLTLNDVKGKRKAEGQVADTRLSSMRAVNAASQSLGGIVQSGWKKSIADATTRTTLATVMTASSSAEKHLSILRKLTPGDVDVERAAISVLGKLVALEMYDISASTLTGIYPNICALVEATSEDTSLLGIPQTTSLPTDPIILNMVSAYLCYAIVVKTQITDVDSLVLSLSSPSTHSLLRWLPAFSVLPSKHVDSLLTRSYSALNKLASLASSSLLSGSRTTKAHINSTPSPQSLFALRVYGLQCLAHTSPGVIDVGTFWEQCNRVTTLLIRSTPPAFEDSITRLLLSSFGEIIRIVGERPDKDVYLGNGGKGKGFLTFCEHWASFARKAGDISELQRINSFVEPHSSSQSSSSTLPPPSSSQQQDIIVAGNKMYNTFGQLSLLFESVNEAENYDALRSSLQQTAQLLKTSSDIPSLLQPVYETPDKRSKDEEIVVRACSKFERTLEKARRQALKLLEMCTSPTSAESSSLTELDDDLRHFLLQCVLSLEHIPALPLCNARTTRDILTRCLDTLFFLSRTFLNTGDPTTFVPTFDLLSKATAILGSVPSSKFSSSPVDDTVDLANFTRCLSGSFYNIAGALYQATRYGNAVPFLIEACSLGQKALCISRPQPPVPNESREKEKEWAQLKEQLYRRWELLAVCYSKNGDRRKAYDCFKHAIYAFPFELSGLLAQCDKLPLDAVFGPSGAPFMTQLSGLLNRMTYLGACELLLSPEEVSLVCTESFQHGVSPALLEPSAIGALLERQLDTLEHSKSKHGVREVIIKLFQDVLAVYSDTMPIRKTRVLIRCMDFLYRDPSLDICRLFGFENIEQIVQRIEDLVSLDSLGKDVHLAQFIPQYRIMAHLWSALHAHRRGDTNQTSLLEQRTESACLVMKELLAGGCDTLAQKAGRKGASPQVISKVMSPKIAKVGKVASPRQTRSSRLRIPAAPKKAVPVARRTTKAKATPDPVTPKARSRTALPSVALNPVQTPRQSTSGTNGSKPAFLFDNYDRFLLLCQLATRILGMFGLILPKAHLLEMTRKVCQRHTGSTSDGYVISSLDLAHEYASLGKLRRAASIFNQALDIVRSGKASGDVAVRFLLRFAESLALIEDVSTSCRFYIEALELSNQLDLEGSAKSTIQRIHARASILEIAATASYVFALVQYAKGEISTSMEGLQQSMRLWNRAAETLARISPQPAHSSSSESDPFQMTALKEALPSTESSRGSHKVSSKRTPADGLEWRISEGLFSVILSISQAYFLRGSGREAEYFVKQAIELAEELNTPALLSRALAKQGRIQLYMGLVDNAQANLTRAAAILADQHSVDSVEISSILIESKARIVDQNLDDDSQRLLGDTLLILEELDRAFQQFDSLALGPRRSLGASPRESESSEVLAPEILCSIICQQLWAMRNEPSSAFNGLLHRLISLSNSSTTKAEENAIMAKLTLHGVYDRFRTDMFLSSLTESTIAVPIGMGSKEVVRAIQSSVEVAEALSNAEKLLWEQLQMISLNGNVVKIRDAAVSLVLVNAFRTSLGDRKADVPSVMVRLLDMTAALTLRRDMLDAIEHKTLQQAPDDLRWPVLSDEGDHLPSPPVRNTEKGRRFAHASLPDSEDEDSCIKPDVLKNYWDIIRSKYKSQLITSSSVTTTETVGLPHNWIIVNISITPDKTTLFISRQECGPRALEPLVFCIPLKGRRDHSSEDDEDNHLTFDTAIGEFRDIVRSSDECTKSAVSIKADDEEARSNWWKQRVALDTRMRELLENIEYCWLGAFKTILSPSSDMPAESLEDLKGQIERIFQRALNVKDKKSKGKTTGKNKSTRYQTNSPSQFTFDDSIIKCFSTLSPKCRTEEMEDFIYFILDLYQFHGVPVAIAEIDLDQVTIDLRTVLEDYGGKAVKSQPEAENPSAAQDEHLFLILDKNVQGLPWESIPSLRGRSVSRIPGIQFLHDRLEFAKLKRGVSGAVYDPKDGAVVDPHNGYYILNPSGDLGRTEERFRTWADTMRHSGWGGVSGKQISEQQFVEALKTRDLVVYFGHGGGEQYVRSHKIRSLPTCAATMLWGCSSGNLRDMGDFDRTGTPYNYILGGCPSLVANLWDVTDKDIDKLSQSVFDKLGLTVKHPNQPQASRTPTSVVAAVAQSRDSCKLKYLTGAAPVVYGIPFYI